MQNNRSKRLRFGWKNGIILLDKCIKMLYKILNSILYSILNQYKFESSITFLKTYQVYKKRNLQNILVYWIL